MGRYLCYFYDQCSHRGENRSSSFMVSAKSIQMKIIVVVVFIT